MNLHIYDQLEQGSPEWHDQRRGMVTASVVGKLLTLDTPDAVTVPCPACNVDVGPCLSLSRKKPTLLKTVHADRTTLAAEQPAVIKVANNDTSRALTTTLVAERITGWTEDTPMTGDMWRGVECEPLARDLYSIHHQAATEVGFMVRDDWGFELGYSPDGLVGDDGLIEIKAPRAKTHLNTILADTVPAHYMAQLQAGLLVSGRNWIDFVSYCGGMPLFVERVYPARAWHDAIVAAVETFEQAATEMVTRYRAAVTGLPETERIDPNIVELKL